jgi:DNA polymerase-1
MINLIDGDLVAYRASSSCEPTRAKPFLEPPEVAIWRLNDMIERICIATNSSEIECYLGGSDNFRYNIYPLYKANRKDKPKPTYLEACREQLVTQYGSSIVNGIETDDMLGIRQTQLDGNSRICSLDKDLLTVPGWHWNWVNLEATLVSPLDGLRTQYKQAILGDKSDNIRGFDGALRGSCPKFIEKLQQPLDEISMEKDMYDYVLSVYLDVDNTQEALDTNMQLLYILRKEDEYWIRPI